MAPDVAQQLLFVKHCWFEEKFICLRNVSVFLASGNKIDSDVRYSVTILFTDNSLIMKCCRKNVLEISIFFTITRRRNI